MADTKTGLKLRLNFGNKCVQSSDIDFNKSSNLMDDESLNNLHITKDIFIQSNTPTCDTSDDIISTTMNENITEPFLDTTYKGGMDGNGKLVLSGEELQRFISSLKLILGGLKQCTISFFTEGVIIQGLLYGQRTFIPLPHYDCTSYEWTGSPAIFLCSVEPRRSLLDALKTDKKKTPTTALIIVSGKAPNRILTQTVSYNNEEDIALHSQHTLMKYELSTSSIMFPAKNPDVTFVMTKQQIGKILATILKSPENQLTFAVKPEGGFFVGNMKEVLHFDIDEKKMYGYPYSGTSASTTSLLKYFTKNHNSISPSTTTVQNMCSKNKDTCVKQVISQDKDRTKYTNPKLIIGEGSGKPFCIALEDTNSFKTIIQKTKTTCDGMDLSFFISEDVKLLRMRIHVPSFPSIYLFCTSDCISIYELEQASLTGHLDTKRENSKKKSCDGNEETTEVECSVGNKSRKRVHTLSLKQAEKMVERKRKKVRTPITYTIDKHLVPKETTLKNQPA